MNNYDEINKVYDNSGIYNSEFINYEDDFMFWTYWIERLKPNSVLEVGIGNGRLIKLLSNCVSTYDGLDVSTSIINDFNHNNNWFKGNIYNQDMKKININRTYDLIILPFNTFCYLYTLDDLKKFFEGIKKISNNNSVIIIDIINPKINDLSNRKIYKYCNKFLVNGKECKLYEKHFYNCNTQVINYSKKYVFSNKKKLILNLPTRVFFHQELLNMLDLFGFEIVNILGDYNNEKFNFNSRKQIFFIKGGNK